MYTIDDDNNNQFDDDDEIVVERSWNNGTGLIVKIIIIILCVIVLIWLIKALKSNNSTKVDEGATHASNVLKLRLAAEDYFFIKNKKTKYSVANVEELKAYGLMDSLTDANGKVCSDKNSKATITKNASNYKMTIKLDCSTTDEEEVFYYHTSNLACQNCDGESNMTGHNGVPNKEEEQENNNNNNNNNNNEEQEEQEDEYSCVAWSEWTKERVNNPLLEERTKTLVQGVKKGKKSSKTVYGKWSEFTPTHIEDTDGLEVETKTVSVDSWGESQTATYVDTSNPNVRIIGTSTEYTSSPCPSGYSLSGNSCYSRSETVGNLTYTEFNSGRYKVNNGLCEGVRNQRTSSGKNELVYINCRYNTIVSRGSYGGSSRTIYTYQEKTSSNVTYYRYRTVQTINTMTEDVYTDKKYEEKDLPEGYVKVDGSEETYYSYKYPSCEK